ncbi:MAG: rubredoxin [Deltaproteobacteria bacterium]|nr:rubredoxin [Deltaproteobacteria bacterium]MBW1950920.1 rubredoxin [Deltaproteobacteria bacterium]MBW2006726.1 rubredoxin [Deltaproteobacteria bacterium]MBW2103612.1 rubredoxin [Deltaproteobacteria bacterium]MBW2349310.1 rubredoxin [Deltaproteobacteria bacterium]
MTAGNRFKKVHRFKCPCGYTYDPEEGDREAGWKPGTPFEDLPDQLTCPRCRRPKVLFREQRFSVPAP